MNRYKKNKDNWMIFFSQFYLLLMFKYGESAVSEEAGQVEV